VKQQLLVALLCAAPMAAQILVVDRPLHGAPQPLRIERAGGAFADSFRFGATGEVWMIEKMRLWAMPLTGTACGGELGDAIEKVTLFGALDNPPVPGQPVCDCHALVALAAAEFPKGSSASANPNFVVTKKNGVWQLDVADVRWSLPAASDAVFTVRVTPRVGSACRAGRQWSLAASSEPEHQLHLLNEKGVPIGLEEAGKNPRSLRIQVWARRSN
jgi:hypothetical protein